MLLTCDLRPRERLRKLGEKDVPSRLKMDTVLGRLSTKITSFCLQILYINFSISRIQNKVHIQSGVKAGTGNSILVTQTSKN